MLYMKPYSSAYGSPLLVTIYSGRPILPLKGHLTRMANLIWWRFLARCDRPKELLNGGSIAAPFTTTVIDLQQHCSIDGTARRNSTCRYRSNVPLVALFWALVALLAHHNSPFFLQCFIVSNFHLKTSLTFFHRINIKIVVAIEQLFLRVLFFITFHHSCSPSYTYSTYSAYTVCNSHHVLIVAMIQASKKKKLI